MCTFEIGDQVAKIGKEHMPNVLNNRYLVTGFFKEVPKPEIEDLVMSEIMEEIEAEEKTEGIWRDTMRLAPCSKEEAEFALCRYSGASPVRVQHLELIKSGHIEGDILKYWQDKQAERIMMYENNELDSTLSTTRR